MRRRKQRKKGEMTGADRWHFPNPHPHFLVERLKNAKNGQTKKVEFSASTTIDIVKGTKSEALAAADKEEAIKSANTAQLED